VVHPNGKSSGPNTSSSSPLPVLNVSRSRDETGIPHYYEDLRAFRGLSKSTGNLQNNTPGPSPSKTRQVIRVVNGSDPSIQSQVLLNTKTSQPWATLVRDLGRAVKLPGARESNHMETLTGRPVSFHVHIIYFLFCCCIYTWETTRLLKRPEIEKLVK